MALTFVYLFTTIITFAVNLYYLSKVGEEILEIKTDKGINTNNLVKFFVVFIVSLSETMLASAGAKVMPAVLSVALTVGTPFLCYYFYTCILPKKEQVKNDNDNTSKDIKTTNEEHHDPLDDIVRDINESNAELCV